MIFKCPGQDTRSISAETISCPDCGHQLEIFSDEIKVKCPKCKRTVSRERPPSCLDWCKSAQECAGEEFYGNYIENKHRFLKDRLLKELEEYFGDDKKRINHAKKVMSFAEELLKKEKADWHIVIPASILHDVGIKIAEEKYGSAAGHYQEKEGPAIARRILLKVGIGKKDIDEICLIIAYHHTPGKVKSPNFNLLYDADWLVNLKDERETRDRDKLQKIINKVFITRTAKDIARELYSDRDAIIDC